MHGISGDPLLQVASQLIWQLSVVRAAFCWLAAFCGSFVIRAKKTISTVSVLEMPVWQKISIWKKMAIYCPKDSGTLRQQLLMMH